MGEFSKEPEYSYIFQRDVGEKRGKGNKWAENSEKKVCVLVCTRINRDENKDWKVWTFHSSIFPQVGW